MDREQIMQIIRDLAKSQGFYGRLYDCIASLEAEQQDKYLTYLEEQNFKDTLDLVLYFEQ